MFCLKDCIGSNTANDSDDESHVSVAGGGPIVEAEDATNVQQFRPNDAKTSTFTSGTMKENNPPISNPNKDLGPLKEPVTKSAKKNSPITIPEPAESKGCRSIPQTTTTNGHLEVLQVEALTNPNAPAPKEDLVPLQPRPDQENMQTFQPCIGQRGNQALVRLPNMSSSAHAAARFGRMHDYGQFEAAGGIFPWYEAELKIRKLEAETRKLEAETRKLEASNMVSLLELVKQQQQQLQELQQQP